MENFYEIWDADVDKVTTDKKLLYQKMLAKYNEEPLNWEVCWRMVRICLVVADGFELTKNRHEAEKYIKESRRYAKTAVEQGPNVMESHKWYCASVGRLADYAGIKERIKYGYEFKEHHDMAIKLNDNDKSMHHMYGRWCFQVASLSRIERTIAETFIAKPPTSSFDEALENLMKAEILNANWKQNKLWIAKTYIALKNYTLAIKFIDDALALPTEFEKDKIADHELKELEKKYAQHRK